MDWCAAGEGSAIFDFAVEELKTKDDGRGRTLRRTNACADPRVRAVGAAVEDRLWWRFP